MRIICRTQQQMLVQGPYSHWVMLVKWKGFTNCRFIYIFVPPLAPSPVRGLKSNLILFTRLPLEPLIRGWLIPSLGPSRKRHKLWRSLYECHKCHKCGAICGASSKEIWSSQFWFYSIQAKFGFTKNLLFSLWSHIWG